jgi:hypothetical protein
LLNSQKTKAASRSNILNNIVDISDILDPTDVLYEKYVGAAISSVYSRSNGLPVSTLAAQPTEGSVVGVIYLFFNVIQ